jgi:hypothetical protein
MVLVMPHCFPSDALGKLSKHVRHHFGIQRKPSGLPGSNRTLRWIFLCPPPGKLPSQITGEDRSLFAVIIDADIVSDWGGVSHVFATSKRQAGKIKPDVQLIGLLW